MKQGKQDFRFLISWVFTGLRYFIYYFVKLHNFKPINEIILKKVFKQYRNFV